MGEDGDAIHDAPNVHARPALAEDLRELLGLVEAIHPDPFVGYDGRVALHARVERIVRGLPETATTEEFYRLAAPVVAGLDDAHSLLRPPDDGPGGEDGSDRRLPVSFRVVGDALYVEAVSDPDHADLLGGRLLAVEGVPLPDLVERSRVLRASENRYGALARAGHAIERYRPLARLLDREAPPDIPTLAVDVPGDERTASVEPTADADPVAELEPTFPRPTGPGPRYRLYRGGDAAVFVPGNLSDYRESLEAKRAASAGVAARQAERAYDRQVGDDPPDSVEETIAALPSMTGTVERMTAEMAEAGTETLVVDLRDNPGGDSQFVFHLAYALQGWDGVARATEGIRVVRRRSEAYRRRYGDAGDGDGDGGTAPDGPGNYDFSGFLERPDGADRPGRVELVRRRLGRSPTATEFLERVDGAGRYRPDRLVVVTSAGTMSSAFAGATQLTALGADVVGVPSGQAPVSFGEHVERTLPNTGLDVRISGSMYHWLDDPSGDVLEPDRELTPARFERHDAAADAGLRLAFEHAGHGDPTDWGPGAVAEAGTDRSR